MGSVKNRHGFAVLYAEKKAPLLADNLRGTLDGFQLAFRPSRSCDQPGPRPPADRLRLQGRLAPRTAAGEVTPFAFEDQNFEDKSGKISLTLDRPATGST